MSECSGRVFRFNAVNIITYVTGMYTSKMAIVVAMVGQCITKLFMFSLCYTLLYHSPSYIIFLLSHVYNQRMPVYRSMSEWLVQRISDQFSK